MSEMQPRDWAQYKRLLSYLKPHRRMVGIVIVATIVYGLCEPLVPLVLQPLIDGGFSELETVHQMVWLLCGGFALRGLANYFTHYGMAYLAQNVVRQLRQELFTQLLRLPMPYFQKHHAGSIVSRFTYDVLQLISASSDAVAIVIRESITIMALLAAMFYFDWRLSLFVLTLAPLLVGLIAFLSKRLRRLARALQTDMGDLNLRIEEALQGRAVIRMHQAEAYENKRFQTQISLICERLLQASRISSAISPLVEILIILALSSVILWAAHQLGQGEQQLTVGRLVSFLGAMALLFPPIKRLGKVSEPLQRGLAAMHSVFDFLDEQQEQQYLNTPATSASVITEGRISLRGISCELDGKTVLTDINLEIAAGEIVALVGVSGSGKSSLAALIAGFYAPSSGVLSLDGIDVQHLSLDQRRQAIAYLGQEALIFWGNVRDNIAYACDTVDEQRLEEAIEAAHLKTVIEALPEGLNQNLGAQGNRLSGGQKQRLALARALYKQAPILIVDEGTAALDQESERYVQSALMQLPHRPTQIIIAHRLHSIRHAHRIVVMEAGRIIEIGSHEALLAAGGRYAQLLQSEHV